MRILYTALLGLVCCGCGKPEQLTTTQTQTGMEVKIPSRHVSIKFITVEYEGAEYILVYEEIGGGRFDLFPKVNGKHAK